MQEKGTDPFNPMLRDWFNGLPGAQTLLALLGRAQETVHTALRQLDTEIIHNAQAAVANGKLYYLHTDQLGTPRVLADETGSVVWSAVYDPFGSATVAPASTVEMNLRFPGQYYDQETGLHYNLMRYYDPQTGRYLTSDPIGIQGGMNTFLYANANPIMFTDPSGLAPKPLPPERQRTRECNSTEYAACQQQCGSKGVQSCKVNQTFSVQGIKHGLPHYGWKDGPMSCSCNDPEGFCSRNPTTCSLGVGAGVCLLLLSPIPDDFLIPGLIGLGAAAQ